MKKILGLIAIFTMTLFAPKMEAQVLNFTSSYNLTSDTVTNAGTNTLKVKSGFTYQWVTAQVIITKISGTPAGNVIMQGSNDGTNFVAIPQWDNYRIVAGDTLVPTNVSGTCGNKIWIFKGSKYLWYRVTYTGSGTMAASMKAYLYQR